MTWAQLTHPDDLAANVEQFERVLAGDSEEYELEKRFLTRNGETVFTRLVLRCVRKPDGTVDYIVAMVQDISDSKRAEQERLSLEKQLLHTQKLESLSVLAGFIQKPYRLSALKEVVRGIQ